MKKLTALLLAMAVGFALSACTPITETPKAPGSTAAPTIGTTTTATKTEAATTTLSPATATVFVTETAATTAPTVPVTTSTTTTAVPTTLKQEEAMTTTTTTTTATTTATTTTATAAATGPTTPGGYPADRKLVITCVGDSITECEYWKNNFFGQLPEASYTVKEFGLSGATAMLGTDKPYATSTMFTRSKASKPDIVVIMLGTNDSRASKWDIPANQNGEKFIQDYLSLIEAYRSLPSHPTVLIATPPTVHKEAYEAAPERYSGITEEYVENYVVPAVYEVGRRANAPVIDVFSATAAAGAEFWYDGVHPSTEAGKEMIGTPIAQAILKEVAGQLS